MPVSSNDYYGKLNERFDVRAAFLRALGFNYQCVPDFHIAVFSVVLWGKRFTIAASAVLHAEDYAFEDIVDSALAFVGKELESDQDMTGLHIPGTGTISVPRSKLPK